MNIDLQQKKCETQLLWAIKKLGYSINPDQVKKIAKIIVQTMTGKWRYFHTLDHIFMVGNSDDPLEILAALFHDWVYVQVDNKIDFNLSHYLTPYIEEEKPSSFLIKDNLELREDNIFNMVCSIFGFKPNQILSPTQGQNEFLSALAAAKILEPFLPISLLARITTIIEATIPFRPKSEDNLTAIDLLSQRLQTTNKKFNLGLSSEEMEETMRESVRLANRDVSSFAHTNTAYFLDNTWILLPETNHNLINTNSYTVKDYRLAIQKMESFLYSLQPELIFSQFKNEPDRETYSNYLNQAEKNLATGKIYLTSKLVTISLLEAISLRLHNDLPLAAMFGNLLKNDNSSYYLDQMQLSLIDNVHEIKSFAEKEALKLLNEGRIKSLEFDTKKSRVTNFLVSKLGFKSIIDLRPIALDFIKNKISGEDFISCFDSDLVNTIINDLIQLMQKRMQALSEPLTHLLQNR